MSRISLTGVPCHLCKSIGIADGALHLFTQAARLPSEFAPTTLCDNPNMAFSYMADVRLPEKLFQTKELRALWTEVNRNVVM